MKTCRKCGVTKEFSEFYRRPEGADGYRTECIDCWKKKAYKFKRDHADRYKEYAFKQSKKHWAEQRHIYNARRVVVQKLRSGELVKPEECSRCGSSKRINAHHEDYSKPADVVWLCFVCHMRRHREIRNASRYSGRHS